MAGRLIMSNGPGKAAVRGVLSTHILASMNLEIVSDYPLDARGMRYEDARGWVGYCDLPPCEMGGIPSHQAAPRDAELCIWVIEKGHLTLEQNNGIPAKFGPGSILLCDVSQPLRGRWERSRFSYIRTAPQWLVQALGHAPGSRARAVEPLEHLVLGPFLGAQLTMLASHGAALSPGELDTVLGSVFRTAEALFKGVIAPRAESGAGPIADRLQAVHRYIQRNLHRPELSVADIARGTSISRAQLYRLFSSQARSVGATLREERLLKSLGYLKQTESSRLSIGAIAYACGFSDQAVFSKTFRRRFGMAPREVRASAHAATRR